MCVCVGYTTGVPAVFIFFETLESDLAHLQIYFLSQKKKKSLLKGFS